MPAAERSRGSPRPRLWLPTLRLGTGVDVFTERLAAGLERSGFAVELEWLPARHEFLPSLLALHRAPSGVAATVCNLRLACGVRRSGVPLLAVKHDCVGDPAAGDWETPRQRFYNRWLTQRWESAGLACATHVVAISPTVDATLRGGYGYARASVIGNGIDTTLFHPLQPPRPAGKRVRLLFVGKPSHRKGADLLLPILAAAGEDFELRFTGRPEQLPGWAEAPSGLRARVTALGTLDQTGVIGEYQTADLLLFPTRSEGFGYATVEAMASGLPVVAGAAGATPWLVEDGVSGVLCPPGDVAAFAAALRRLAADPDMRRRVAAAARARVELRFSLAAQVDAYATLLRSLLNPGGQPAADDRSPGSRAVP